MTNEEFEEIVKEGIEEIPKKFLEKLENIDICVEEEPSTYQLEKLKTKRGSLILGLYEGVPKTKRWRYSQVLPDKITIFRKAIERMARSKKEIKEVIRNTVWHEIAHHFGMNEKEVQTAEYKRKK